MDEKMIKCESVPNNERASVSYPVMYENELGSYIIGEVRNFTLEKMMYDCHVIGIDSATGFDLGDPSILVKMTIEVSEVIGPDLKSVSFNMGTRQLTEESEATSDEAIFYDDSFTFNPDTGMYEMRVFVAAKCSYAGRELGFNDSMVSVVLGDAEGGPSWTYRANLPPFLIQGRPKMGVYEDSVFPNQTDRVDIGSESSENPLDPYFGNSLGYRDDYLFVGSGTKYSVDTSGFIPADITDYVSFSNLNARLLDERTGMSENLDSSASSSGARTLLVMTDDRSASDRYEGDFQMTVWNTPLETSGAKFSKNVLDVWATLVNTDV